MIPKAILALLLGLGLSGLYLWISTAKNPPTTAPTLQVAKASPSPEMPAKKLEQSNQLSGRSREVMLRIFARFQAGDYGAALALADSVLQEEDLDPKLFAWIKLQLPNLLIAAGWLQLQSHQCDQAILHLRRADALGNYPLAQKGLGICYYRDQLYAPAEEFLSAYLEKNAQDSDARLILSDALESQQRFAAAADQLKLILEAAPKPEIESRYKTMLSRAQEGQRQLTTASQHFQITYRAEEHEDLVNEVIDILENAVDEFIDTYGFDPPNTMIEVVLYPSEGFRSNTNSPDWARGIFDGRLRIPVYEAYADASGQDQLRRVLRHELVHAMLSQKTNARSLPAWFNEGIAQRLECKTACERALFPATPGRFLKAEVLEMPYTSYQAVQAELSYRQSLYMILTLEDIERLQGTDPLYRVVRSVRKNSKISSDGILTPLEITYNRLHREAASRWERRHRF